MEEQLLTILTALKVEEASSLGHLCSEVYIENSLFWKCSLPLAACLVEPALLVVSLCPPARPFLGPRLLIRKSRLQMLWEAHVSSRSTLCWWSARSSVGLLCRNWFCIHLSGWHKMACCWCAGGGFMASQVQEQMRGRNWEERQLTNEARGKCFRVSLCNFLQRH